MSNNKNTTNSTCGSENEESYIKKTTLIANSTHENKIKVVDIPQVVIDNDRLIKTREGG